MTNKKYYVYLLKCNDNSLYCGYTVDLQNRVSAHNNKTGAKYTRSRTPVELVYYETFSNKSDALKRECSIKKLTRDKKLLLIKSFEEQIKNS
ncbi:putative endonuclease [Peptoniphilus asaccharolyticus DSM 20463]|uniref:Putative endonuclease n=1 Tax=Peptoniphilus asaccharolyticus DSM 20463 TaxID=573058 RepID=A0A1W1UVG1_PEPAS|nr:GIY-YIG nuclease family protein [Peptoniphilus asaccharolyticus]MBL7575261.1 GIY-YIG nuclease family protein [Peptoniphilus asaccharolyticus]SMB85135.1 putative endonuclease [Peptoniphilus asaccharolyticus DSM 20463]